MNPTPYLSFVVTTRNDNYGENQLHRNNVFVRALLRSIDKHGLDAELIIVEWNPPEDRPRLARAIDWTGLPRTDHVRIIEVPPQLHCLFPNASRLGLFEYLGKNVGIRRARGRFIVATNPDLLLSEELVAQLARHDLDPACFYRVDRYDVWEKVPPDLDLEGQLAFCAANVFRVSTQEDTFAVDVVAGGQVVLQALPGRLKRLRAFLARRNWPTDRCHCNAAGDFTLASREHWLRVRGCPDQTVSGHADAFVCLQAVAAGLRQIVFPDPMRIYHQEHDRNPVARRPMLETDAFMALGNQMLENHDLHVTNPETWGIANMPLPEWSPGGEA